MSKCSSTELKRRVSCWRINTCQRNLNFLKNLVLSNGVIIDCEAVDGDLNSDVKGFWLVNMWQSGPFLLFKHMMNPLVSIVPASVQRDV